MVCPSPQEAGGHFKVMILHLDEGFDDRGGPLAGNLDFHLPVLQEKEMAFDRQAEQFWKS